ncbi:uncharacterized protein LOC116254582 [Nymphaea colorata]|nr:uncharacterized protein LOC116254582 [Nymphaea colorata]
MEEFVRSHAIAAASAVTFSTAFVYPLDTLKTLLQVGAGTGPKLDIRQVCGRLQSIAGLSGFYSGFGWTVLGRIPAIGTRFGLYELFTAFYKDGREDNHVYVSEALLAGLASGAVEAVISTPFDLFKLRMQVASACHSSSLKHHHADEIVKPIIAKLLPGYVPDKLAWVHNADLLSKLPNKHPNLIDALKGYPWLLTGSGRQPSAYDVKGPSQVVTLEGWSSIWRGLRPGLFRDSIFSGIFFSCWQAIHIALLEWKSLEMDHPQRFPEEISSISPIEASIAAGISGSIAAASSHSFDTAKSRSQCVVIPKYIAMERKLLKWKPPGTWFERLSGIHPADRQMLSRGIGLRMVRSGVACTALVGSYFLAVDYLL